MLELADVFSESWVSSHGPGGSNYSRAACTLGGEVARELDLVTSVLICSDLF